MKIIMAKDGVDVTQEEIAEEMAKALGHSGYLLEVILEKMEDLEKRLATTEDVEKYNLIVDEYNALRKDAVTRRDMLIIHREAIGFHKHLHLDESYPIPRKKKKKPVHGNDKAL